MPRQLDPRIAEILKNYGEDPRDTNGVIWDCHGTWVVYHRALERVAARAGISFSKPEIIRSERDEAVILVSAQMGEREDWDIGEALIGSNYRVSGKQAAFVYAMALKRARDRLILKLVGLHGLLYSEEEADEFKHGNQPDQRSSGSSDFPGDQPNDNDPGKAAADFIAACEVRIKKVADRPTLLTWWNSDGRKSACRDFDLTEDQIRALYQKVKDRAEALQPRSAA